MNSRFTRSCSWRHFIIKTFVKSSFAVRRCAFTSLRPTAKVQASWKAVWEMVKVTTGNRKNKGREIEKKDEKGVNILLKNTWARHLQVCLSDPVSSYVNSIHIVFVFPLCVAPHCHNTDDRSRPRCLSLRSEALLCVALALNPVSFNQRLLIAAQTGLSREALGGHDYTLVALCWPGGGPHHSALQLQLTTRRGNAVIGVLRV